MATTRRTFMGAAASGIATASLLSEAARAGTQAPAAIAGIVPSFQALPGDKALKIYAPATAGSPEFLLEYNASQLLFIGSATKAFILGEALQRVDSPTVVQSLEGVELTLDDTVWSLGSPSFNPPDLTGLVTERTTLEAMIMHSDNTATDMMLKYLGPANVRAFIASAGLTHTFIPDSTRALFGYIFGAANYRTLSYDQLLQIVDGPVVHSPLNPVETMASTADDLISYYSRALQGAFFQHEETLTEFRRILTLGDAIYMLPMPLGVSAYSKGGSLDVPGFHCICVPGAMFFSDRWVYFAMTLNWYTQEETDLPTLIAFAAAGSQALAAVKELLAPA
jgi:beta-lactamase class A